MEPRGPDGRLADVTDGSPHTSHDQLLIAALAAGDLAGAELERAGGLVDSCGACRAIHEDLVALARVMRSSPPAVPARRVDFRLTEEDASRQSSAWRRLATWLAGPRGTITRPLATGLATVGVAAVLLSTAPLSMPGGGSAAAPAEVGRVTGSAAPTEQLAPAPGKAPDAAAEQDLSGAAASPAAGGPSAEAAAPDPGTSFAEGSREATVDDTNAPTSLAVESAGPDPLMVAGFVLIGGAVVVFALRPLARRLA